MELSYGDDDGKISFSPMSSQYPSPVRTYDGESVSSDHCDVSCNVITMDVNFMEEEVHIHTSPEDIKKTRIEARRELGNRAKVTIKLKPNEPGLPQNHVIEASQIVGYPYPE